MAIFIDSIKSFLTSSIKFSYGLSSLLCIRIHGTSYLAATEAILLSFLNPHTSFIISAPALIAASAVFALYVSIETVISNFSFIALITGTTLFISSSTSTTVKLGLVDSPPTSIISAPWLIISSTLFNAISTSLNLPPSENESGVAFNIPIT